MSLVVYLGPADALDAAEAALRGRANVEMVAPEPASVASALENADGLLDASMRVSITDQMIDAAPRLRIISCATTGSDHIARAAAERRGVTIRTLREDPEVLRNLTPAAELSWALLMACARRLKGAFHHVEDGLWSREQFPGLMLNGKTLGLVGCGRIGGWMARYAHAFGMRVVAHDPYQAALPDGVNAHALVDLMQECDIVSVHVHLTNETRGLISRNLLQSCRRGLILINTSRGAVVDEHALLDALRSGRVAAAGLDVLHGEPDVASHPLVEYARTHENLIITPHCGGFSPDAVRIVTACAAQKIAAALDGAL